MDKALYIGMSGAMATLRAQGVNAHNLANASTVGFRAEEVNTRQAQIFGDGFASRFDAHLQASGWNSREGTIMTTGRDMDVAFSQDNWLAVQAGDGTEAYTRGGDLQVDAVGRVLTGAGQPVLGENGPLSVPPNSSITIGGDGTVTVIPLGQSAAAPAPAGRLKVMSATPDQLERGSDGLMRAKQGVELTPAAGDVVASGVLEASNVNVADSMVTMINLARSFELQTKVMKAAEDNDAAASSIVRMR